MGILLSVSSDRSAAAKPVIRIKRKKKTAHRRKMKNHGP
jgi:hypothetical protein